ncbi:hypothetical protein BC830DRAFT_1152339 [Chytriomyces sp. MP71]|nr:hypothetical protein BC830DRAFT_1152339 [Chytriomyces sp. MP71]
MAALPSSTLSAKAEASVSAHAQRLAEQYGTYVVRGWGRMREANPNVTEGSQHLDLCVSIARMRQASAVHLFSANMLAERAQALEDCLRVATAPTATSSSSLSFASPSVSASVSVPQFNFKQPHLFAKKKWFAKREATTPAATMTSAATISENHDDHDFTSPLPTASSLLPALTRTDFIAMQQRQRAAREREKAEASLARAKATLQQQHSFEIDWAQLEQSLVDMIANVRLDSLVDPFDTAQSFQTTLQRNSDTKSVKSMTGRSPKPERINTLELHPPVPALPNSTSSEEEAATASLSATPITAPVTAVTPLPPLTATDEDETPTRFQTVDRTHSASILDDALTLKRRARSAAGLSLDVTTKRSRSADSRLVGAPDAASTTPLPARQQSNTLSRPTKPATVELVQQKPVSQAPLHASGVQPQARVIPRPKSQITYTTFPTTSPPKISNVRMGSNAALAPVSVPPNVPPPVRRRNSGRSRTVVEYEEIDFGSVKSSGLAGAGGVVGAVEKRSSFVSRLLFDGAAGVRR